MCLDKGIKNTRAFSLIEVVIAVLVLAIAVPPTLNLLEDAGAGRVDSINTTRATMLAMSVIEMITADIDSSAEGLGFDALADEALYFETPNTGFHDRIESLIEPYLDVGLSYSVDIGALVSADGSVSEDVDENVFRVITVRVTFPSANTSSYVVPISTMVSAL